MKVSINVNVRINLGDESDSQDRAVNHLCIYPRSPDAMRAAQAEVDRVLRESGHTPENLDKPVVLSKEQLDSMLVLGE